MAKGIKVTDKIKVVNQVTLKYPGLLGGPSVTNHKGPLNVEEEGRRSQAKRDLKMF